MYFSEELDCDSHEHDNGLCLRLGTVESSSYAPSTNIAYSLSMDVYSCADLYRSS